MKEKRSVSVSHFVNTKHYRMFQITKESEIVIKAIKVLKQIRLVIELAIIHMTIIDITTSSVQHGQLNAHKHGIFLIHLK